MTSSFLISYCLSYARVKTKFLKTDIKQKNCKNTALTITVKKPNLTGRKLCTPNAFSNSYRAYKKLMDHVLGHGTNLRIPIFFRVFILYETFFYHYPILEMDIKNSKNHLLLIQCL